MKLIYLTALSLSSCAYNPKKLTPAFIDAKRMTCREYHVTQTKPTVEFAFTAEHPIEHCDGYISLPLEQGLEIKRAYEESRKRKSMQVEPSNDPIQNELEILGGIELNPDANILELK